MFINKVFSPPVVGNHGGEPLGRKGSSAFGDCFSASTDTAFPMDLSHIIYGWDMALSRHGPGQNANRSWQV